MPPGRVVALYTAPEAGAPMEAHGTVQAIAGVGLDGDRYARERGTYTNLGSSPRHVTLIEREAIEAVRRDDAIEVAGQETRRNIVTEGVALNHLVGRTFRVGAARLRGTKLSEPCAYLEGLVARPGLRAALVHRGGLRAEIVGGGAIRVGDAIHPDSGHPDSRHSDSGEPDAGA